MLALFAQVQIHRDNVGFPGAIIAQTHNDLKTLLLPSFLAHLPPRYEGQAPIDRIQPGQESPIIDRVSLGDRWMRFRNGSTVYWGSADQKVGWEGPTWAWMAGDELRLWPREALRRATARTRLNTGLTYKRFTTTPSMGWVSKFYNSPHVECIRASTRENPYNDPGYVDEMLAVMSAAEARVFIDGLDVPLSGQVFADYDDESIVDYAYDPALPVSAFLDFGYRHPYVGFAQRSGERIVVFDEIVRTETTTEQIAHAICELPYALDFVAVDPAGAGTNTARGDRDIDVLASILRRKWPSVRVVWQTDPRLRSVPAGIDAVRGLIKSAIGRSTLFVADDLTRRDYGRMAAGLHQSLLGLAFPEKRGGAAGEQPAKDGVLDHACDALRYGVVNLWLPEHRQPAPEPRVIDQRRKPTPERLLDRDDIGGWKRMEA